MNRVETSHLRATLVVALVLAAAHAAEDKPVPVSPAGGPTEDSISAAKRNFDAIKSAREAELGGKRALPGISVPELSTAPATPGPWASPKSMGMQKKSANWLVDAMEKKTEARHGAKTEKGEKLERSEKNENEFLFGTRELDVDSAERKSLETERREQPDRKKTTEAPNPFARYLGDWMTPQDYALLKSGLDKSAGINGAEQRYTLPAPGDMAMAGGVLGKDSALGLVPAITPNNPPAVAAPNPYLQSLAGTPAPLPPPPPNPIAGGAIPGPMSAPPPVISAPPLTQPKNKIPDFAKPPGDEKHFKQLKRF